MHTTSILSFFWHHIKPYKWFYAVMLSGPLVAGVFPFAYNYSIKLFIDAMTANNTITYSSIMYPILLFIFAQIIMEIFWKLGFIAEWKTEPYVRKSILLQSYDTVQHHSYIFFQNNFTGAISSKIKGLLDGYDKFWAEIHHGFMLHIFKIIVGLIALIAINTYLGLFILLWCLHELVLFQRHPYPFRHDQPHFVPCVYE